MSRVSTATDRAVLVRSSPAFALVLFAVSFATAASAQEDLQSAKQEAKARFMSGQRHYNLNELPEALADFKDAYRLYPDPVFLFNLGQCERQLGHHEEAIRFYRNFLREQPKAPNRQEVLHKIEEMEAAIKSRPPEVEKLPPVAAPEAIAPAPETAAPESATKEIAAQETLPAEQVEIGPATAAPTQPRAGSAAEPWPGPAERTLSAGPIVGASEGQTARIELGSAPAEPAPAPALYRRWWVWTAAAVIAAGVGLGIYAATRGQAASAPSVDLGTQKVF
jgi:tetratricopeptide (TPR) repeat protein